MTPERKLGANIGPENHDWRGIAHDIIRDQFGTHDREAYNAEQQAATDSGATDAGERCGVCGDPVSWMDHLPPLGPGKSVRCFAGYREQWEATRAAELRAEDSRRRMRLA